jgi:hypothetical protein
MKRIRNDIIERIVETKLAYSLDNSRYNQIDELLYEKLYNFNNIMNVNLHTEVKKVLNNETNN